MPLDLNKEDVPTFKIKKWGFPVLINELSEKQEIYSPKKHRHDYFEIFFFTIGGGTHLIDFSEYPIKNNSCYILFPQQVHLINRAKTSRGFVLCFETESIFSEKLQNLIQERAWQDLGPIFFEENIELMETIEPLIHQLRKTENKKFSFGSDMAKHLLHVILYKLISTVNLSSSKHNLDPAFQQFLFLIDRNFKENHSVEFYLQKLNIGRKKLGYLSKKHMGLTPLQIIHRRLILESKRLLLFRNKPHKEISFSLGFESPGSFSAFLKTKTGRSPSQIQQEIFKKYS